jgi:8-oxo-dGTP diphosphatase
MKDEYQYLVSRAVEEGIDRYVVAALAFRQGEVLLLRRKADDFMGGLYELPSGRVDGQETLVEALDRETHEETGCSVTAITGYLGAFDYESKSGRKTRQFTFLVDLAGTDSVRLTEHDAYVWASPTTLRDIGVSDSVRTLLHDAFGRFGVANS